LALHIEGAMRKAFKEKFGTMGVMSNSCSVVSKAISRNNSATQR